MYYINNITLHIVLCQLYVVMILLSFLYTKKLTFSLKIIQETSNVNTKLYRRIKNELFTESFS